MVSPELLRRYTFFGGLSMEHIVMLAQVADEVAVDEGHYFYHEGDSLDFAYLVLEGSIAIVIELVEKDTEIVVNEVMPGEVFGWSGVLPPHEAEASAKAQEACRLVALDCRAIREHFEQDAQFAYLLTQRVAQTLRDRLNDLRIESLAYGTEA
jgi:CRP-like cAMP-binding protein